MESDGDVPTDEPEVTLVTAYDSVTFVADAHAAHSFERRVQRTLSLTSRASDWLTTLPWTFTSFSADNANGGARVLSDGKSALYLVANPDESKLTARLEARIDASAYRGAKMHLHGMLATSGAMARPSLSVSVFGEETAPALVFERAPANPLTGTRAWEPVDVTLAVPRNARTIAIDLILSGGGTVWLSNLSLFGQVENSR